MGFFEQKPFLVSYYPRFGFEPASHYRIRCEWNVPDTAFMILLLDEPQMRKSAGLARYLHHPLPFLNRYELCLPRPPR